MKRKKIVITESQYNRLFKPLVKESDYHIILDNIVNDLNNNYETVTAVYKRCKQLALRPRISQ